MLDTRFTKDYSKSFTENYAIVLIFLYLYLNVKVKPGWTGKKCEKTNSTINFEFNAMRQISCPIFVWRQNSTEGLVLCWNEWLAGECLDKLTSLSNLIRKKSWTNPYFLDSVICVREAQNSKAKTPQTPWSAEKLAYLTKYVCVSVWERFLCFTQRQASETGNSNYSPKTSNKKRGGLKSKLSISKFNV